MRKVLAFLTGLALAGVAFAHNCPNEMKAIDARLSTRPALSSQVSDQVAKLRASGEQHHKAGRHDAAMKDLGEARKLLGI
jgi:hypothetical protein